MILKSFEKIMFMRKCKVFPKSKQFLSVKKGQCNTFFENAHLGILIEMKYLENKKNETKLFWKFIFRYLLQLVQDFPCLDQRRRSLESDFYGGVRRHEWRLQKIL